MNRPQICEKFAAEPGSWTVVIDPFYMAPYAYKDTQWIGYDDRDSLRTKVKILERSNVEQNVD